MADPAATTLDPGSLKVAELRVELSSRRLSTKGLKKDLVKRLADALQSETAGDTEKGHQPADTEGGEATDRDSGEPESQVSEDADEIMAEDSALSVDAALESTTKTVADKVASDVEVLNSVVGKNLADVSASEGPPKKKRAFSPIRPPSPVNRLLPTLTLRATPNAGVTSQPGPVKDNAENVNNVEASNVGHMSEKKCQELPKFPESSSIYVLGLHRPFTNPNLKKMLEEHGTIKFFWINGIKSHCYVTFADVQSAIAARSLIHGAVWPPQTGHELAVDFITADRMQALVEEEEQAQQARKRVRVIESSEPSVVLSIEDATAAGPKSATSASSAVETPPDNEAIGHRAIPGSILNRLGPLAPAVRPLVASAGGGGGGGVDQPQQKENERQQPVSLTSTSKTPRTLMPKHVAPDQVFQKTETKPPLYYLPLTEEQVAEKVQAREV